MVPGTVVVVPAGGTTVEVVPGLAPGTVVVVPTGGTTLLVVVVVVEPAGGRPFGLVL